MIMGHPNPIFQVLNSYLQVDVTKKYPMILHKRQKAWRQNDNDEISIEQP